MQKNVKEMYIKDLEDKFSRSEAFFLVMNNGVRADKMYELRKLIKQEDGELKIIKNTLAKRASSKFSYSEEFGSFLEGPLGIAFSYSNPVSIAKVLTKAIDDGYKIDFSVAYLNSVKLGKSQIEALAKLPSRDELLSQLLRVLNGPITGLVQVLAAVPRDFLGVLNAIKEKKQ